MKKDERQVSLDPMEWRDAMKDVAKKAPAKKPAAKKKAPAAKGKGKVSGSRR